MGTNSLSRLEPSQRSEFVVGASHLGHVGTAFEEFLEVDESWLLGCHGPGKVAGRLNTSRGLGEGGSTVGGGGSVQGGYTVAVWEM